MHKYLLFDIWGTLYNWSAAIENGLKAIIHFTKTNNLEALNAQYRDTYIKNPIIHWDIVWWELEHFKIMKNIFSQKENILDIFNTYKEASSKMMLLFPDVKDTLVRLRNKGYVLSILSNWRSIEQRRKLISWEIMQLFSYVLVSEDIDIMKPDKTIFDYICTKQWISPNKCIMVGDSLLDDIIPAINCGMDAILFNPNSDAINIDIKQFRSFSEIEWIIRQLK